ncbi:hypothetical protein MLD38_021965 [Melastoma candidum]|uniref:Uncharacterized protein n=1 Tax=Melastoma candidum TaxID=119954 RepID=A0ACB9QHS0_9MYRT|nr:hypothetical protein MLD38_021965 [Melastoma candidum]
MREICAPSPSLSLNRLHETATAALHRHHRPHKLPSLCFRSPNPSFPSLLLPANSPRPSRGPLRCIPSSASASIEGDFNVELGRLLGLLPEEMRQRVSEHPEANHLIEVVMDLGRQPFARFPSGDFVLSELPVTLDDLERATSQVGDFAIDNRAGISRTLHRISAIRNRKGTIIGLTCRVGRAISGSATLLRDLIQNGASLLLIGPPGVGKTTVIREIARMLANDYKKRVMIVDTSNEIGGDGDIPHEGIGNARRMQVPNSEMQHKVLIEAVENHMPQVIVIDEIGTKLEALAASTIAQRGIQLVATAHGVTIENLIMNPALEMLVGGIQSVTLGDEEASRRGVQKTVLERRGPSTFSCAVEIVSKSELRVHRSLEATVDAVLSGRLPNVEVRKVGCNNDLQRIETGPVADVSSENGNQDFWTKDILVLDSKSPYASDATESPHEESTLQQRGFKAPLRLFSYGILEASVVQAVKQFKLDEDSVLLTDNISEADALLALQSKLKKNPRIQAAVRSRGIPTYVTKTSSLVQIAKALTDILQDRDSGNNAELEQFNTSEKIDALEEARIAIEQIVIPKGEVVELLPRPPSLIYLQRDLARKYQLQSEKVGKEQDARLRIFPFQYDNIHDEEKVDDNEGDDKFEEFESTSYGVNGSANDITRLPLLPD